MYPLNSRLNLADISRYRIGVESSLSKANLLESLDMTVLQAFIIYLVRELHVPELIRSDIRF
jgi:hypothetical protein